MNIWCISKYASTPNYGTAARLFFLTKEFIAQGHDACLITSDSNHLASFPSVKSRYNVEEIDKVPVYWIKTKKYKKTASFSRVLSWLDFELGLFFLKTKGLPKPDVVIVSSLSLFTVLYGFFLKKKFQAKLVFEVRDIWPLTLIEEGGFSKCHPLVLVMGWLERFGYKRSDLIVGTMPRLDVHVKEILGYDKQVFCSPLGFVEDGYIKASVKTNYYTLPKNKVLIGYAGSMGLTNALESFIKTIKSFKDDERLYFVLIGDGDLKAQFQKELCDCKNVGFFPKTEQRNVGGFLKQCDVLYLSVKNSKVWDYGQSMNKVVEYMLAGKPIIATYQGYPSMIDEANCGMFVSSSSDEALRKAILEMVNIGGAERELLGERGRAWIRPQRSYTALAKEYLLELEKLLLR